MVEPSGRNTAAAIALATVAIDRPEDDVMVVLPADHHIEDEATFRGVLRAAHDELARGAFEIEAPLVTLGIKPSRPATEYGYLVPDLDHRRRGKLTAYQLRAFEEKPAARGPAPQRARCRVERRDVPLATQGDPGRAREVHAADADDRPAYGSDVALNGVYEKIQAISIDRAVMEGTPTTTW